VGNPQRNPNQPQRTYTRANSNRLAENVSALLSNLQFSAIMRSVLNQWRQSRNLDF
jgi:hypothetical protein